MGGPKNSRNERPPRTMYLTIRIFIVEASDPQWYLRGAQKSSKMFWEEPKKRSKWSQEWSGRSPKKLRNDLRGASPKQLRNGLGGAQNSSEMVRELRNGLGGGGGGKVSPAIVLGFGSLPLTLKGSTALTASVGLALLWSVQQPQLYLGCTFGALRSLAKLGLVASPQQDFGI